jgi:hypothetical protein
MCPISCGKVVIVAPWKFSNALCFGWDEEMRERPETWVKIVEARVAFEPAPGTDNT